MRTIVTWSAGSSIGAPQVKTDGGPRWHQELDYREPRKAASQYVFRHCQCQVLARLPLDAETNGIQRRVAPGNGANNDRIAGRSGPIVPQPVTPARPNFATSAKLRQEDLPKGDPAGD